MPTGVGANQQKLSFLAKDNFGSFETLCGSDSVDHGLKVTDYHHITGVNGQSLGEGVQTTVLLLLIISFVFVFCQVDVCM